MAGRPRVYVALKIAPSDLERIRSVCATEVWDNPGSPPRTTVLEKIVGCDGAILYRAKDGESLVVHDIQPEKALDKESKVCADLYRELECYRMYEWALAGSS